jgi:aminoglycoside phosphotransferase (APT) family kinase protein
MHVLTIEDADGGRRNVSLRRFVPGHHYGTPEHVAGEFEVLRLVRAAGVGAPEPLWLDAEGELFGVPTMVLSYLPGAPLYAPRDERSWLRQLAGALLPLHAITPDQFDLSRLQVHLADEIRDQLARRADAAHAHSELAGQVHDVLSERWEQIAWPAPCLIHDDYWPGNTVWHRQEMVAIIDWTPAKVGDPRNDVSQCRVDLSLSHGPETAEAFLEAYIGVAPAPLPDVWYFDLHRGLEGLLFHERWLEGYHDAGLTHLTPALARRRIEAFVRSALAAVPGTRAPLKT